MNMSSPIRLHPAPGTKTGRVWEIADRISAEKGRQATRKQVIEASVAGGIKRNTAATQYQLWKRDRASQEQLGSSSEVSRPGNSERVALQIGRDGRLLIPTELRTLMMIGPEGKLTAQIKEGELRIISPLMALHKLQELVRKLDRGTGSPVDELLAERRAEARNE